MPEFDLSRLVEPTAEAIEGYQTLSDGRMSFDPLRGRQLTPDPNKPNYFARSESPVIFRDGTQASLVTIAFMPEDGTGNSSLVQLENTWTPGLPNSESVLPRRKDNSVVELALPLLALDHRLETSAPQLFGGYLEILGLVEKSDYCKRDNMVEVIGWVGRSDTMFTEPMATSSVTVGPVTDGALDLRRGKRLGDPHAMFNKSSQLMVVSFMSLGATASAEAFAAIEAMQPEAHFYKNAA